MTGLKDLVARVPPARPIEDGGSRNDAAAERLGFKSREPEERVFRRERDTEASVSLNMRVKLSVSNAFVTYCQENNLSYPQAITKMMQDLGIYKPKG